MIRLFSRAQHIGELFLFDYLKLHIAALRANYRSQKTFPDVELQSALRR